jgi:8-oxo-dGTP diphosphatase
MECHGRSAITLSAGHAPQAYRGRVERLEVVAAAIVDDLARPTRLLAARRTDPPELAGGWELPGGKVDPGESATEALHREIREELGVAIRTGLPVPAPDDGGAWPLGDRYRMHVWLAVVTEGDPHPVEWSHGDNGRSAGSSKAHDALRWLDRSTLYSVGWLPADRPIVSALERLMVRSTPNP